MTPEMLAYFAATLSIGPKGADLEVLREAQAWERIYYQHPSVRQQHAAAFMAGDATLEHYVKSHPRIVATPAST